jgi:hypothetical protein
MSVNPRCQICIGSQHVPPKEGKIIACTIISRFVSSSRSKDSAFCSSPPCEVLSDAIVCTTRMHLEKVQNLALIL